MSFGLINSDGVTYYIRAQPIHLFRLKAGVQSSTGKATVRWDVHGPFETHAEASIAAAHTTSAGGDLRLWTVVEAASADEAQLVPEARG